MVIDAAESIPEIRFFKFIYDYFWVLCPILGFVCIQDTLSSRAALGLPAECVARAKVSCIQGFRVQRVRGKLQNHQLNLI